MIVYRVLIGDASKVGYFSYVDLQSEADLCHQKYRSSLISIALVADIYRDEARILDGLYELSRDLAVDVTLSGFGFKEFDPSCLKDGSASSGFDYSQGSVLNYQDGEFFISASIDWHRCNVEDVMREIYIGNHNRFENGSEMGLLVITRCTFPNSSIDIKMVSVDK